MQGKEKKLFRQEALERLSSPERLDQLMQVVNPRVWLPLATMGSLLTIGLLWSIFGRIPITVSGQGLLINPGEISEIQTSNNGQILALHIKPGDVVKKNQLIATIELPELEQRLQQERDRLVDLEIQNEEKNPIIDEKFKLERQDLEQQKANLEKSLERESIASNVRQENLELLAQNRQSLEKSLQDTQELLPILREKNMVAIAQKRESLQARLEQIESLLPTLEERIQGRRELLKKQLITGDALLSAEQEYFNSLTELSDLESQLKELDLQETNSQQQYLENLNQVSEIKARLQELDVQETSTQRQYLESLNKIDQIKASIEQNKTDLAKIKQQELEENFQTVNQLAEVKRNIAQLEQEMSSKTEIRSESDGRILAIDVVPGQVINAGTSVGFIQKITENDEQDKLMSIAYFPDRDGKKIKPGMSVQITPNIVKRERYGGIIGEIKEVSSFAVTTQNIGVVIGNREIAEKLSQTLSQGSAVIIQTIAELETDPNTVSGYKWSSSEGPPIELSAATTTLVRVKTGSRAPISYVIPLFRDWTGIY